jgi:hypothetical protein
MELAYKSGKISVSSYNKNSTSNAVGFGVDQEVEYTPAALSKTKGHRGGLLCFKAAL